MTKLNLNIVITIAVLAALILSGMAADGNDTLKSLLPESQHSAADFITATSENVEKVLSSGSLTSLLAALEKKDILIASGDLAKISSLVWQKYVDEITSDGKRRAEHDSKSVTFDKMTMKYACKVVGDKPGSGYPLYIAMHGGGGGPATVNDSQWEHMKLYYLNGVTNGIYLAPRGLNNAWNLHWINQSFACYDRIIENMIAFGEVDPNRVYILGYSAGGDAAYQIPARMPDRWAAAGMSAGHPNGVPPDNYAALAFLIQVGEKDSAYKRNQVAAEYGVKLKKLAADNPGLYRHAAYIHKGRSHGIMDHGPAGTKQKVFADPSAWLEKGPRAPTSELDCHSIRWLDQFTRTPLPGKIIWDCRTRCERNGSSEPGFWPTSEKGNLNYWIGIDRYDKTPKLEADRIVAESDRSSNTIKIKEIGNFARLYLSPKMLDLNREVTVLVNGLNLKAKPQLSLKILVQSILDRGDPNYAFPACLTLSKNPEGTWMLE